MKLSKKARRSRLAALGWVGPKAKIHPSYFWDECNPVHYAVFQNQKHGIKNSSLSLNEFREELESWHS